jgi:hypothetical protein
MQPHADPATLAPTALVDEQQRQHIWDEIAAYESASTAWVSPTLSNVQNLLGGNIPEWVTSTLSKSQEQLNGNSSKGWILPPRNRRLGMGYRGDWARLRVALNELITGRNFTLSTIGGSVTEGAGSWDWQPAWPTRLLAMLQKLFPLNPNIRLVNGARAATGPDYMSLCIDEHVPKNATLIISE